MAGEMIFAAIMMHRSASFFLKKMHIVLSCSSEAYNLVLFKHNLFSVLAHFSRSICRNESFLITSMINAYCLSSYKTSNALVMLSHDLNEMIPIKTCRDLVGDVSIFVVQLQVDSQELCESASHFVPGNVRKR